MKITDFAIGKTFWCGGNPWRCTDIGTRIITGIKLNEYEDHSWYNGPPYAVAEHVFDEYDRDGCRSTQEEWMADFDRKLEI